MPAPLELLAIVNSATPCLDGEFCKYSPSNHPRPCCNQCRLSPDAPDFVTEVWWRPINSKYKNRQLEKEKREAKRAKTIAKRQAEKAKDPARKARLAQAERAERRTNAEIIKATRNSGRVNRDGDHLLHDYIVIDTKLQSKAENPVVHLQELEKVRSDAKRSGKSIGVLCIKNKNAKGIVVLDEADFAILVTPRP
jgi:hypothetical protein